jgi:hypothetical protein
MVVTCGRAQDAAAPATRLTAEDIRTAAFSDSFSIPSPGELFAAFNKTGKPDWSAMIRKSPSITFTNRPQLALNLGALIADGFLAVEAQEKQEIKNISHEIKGLAKGLGLGQDVVNRSNSISDFADGRQWEALGEELEAVQNELAAAMNGHQDRELVALMSLGAWLRAVEIVSGFLVENYDPGRAGALRQPSVCSYFARRLDAMPAKIKATPPLAVIRPGLQEIQRAISSSREQPPSAADVKKLNALARESVAAMSSKRP